MKKIYFATVLASGLVFFSSCDNSSQGSNNKSTDSSATTIPAPGNSSATNPSMADTAFSKDHSDTLNLKKDSAGNKQ